jgi:phospholipid-transporting ATPase
MVTMEIVKYVQSSMIDNDLDLYYEKTNTPATARSSSLIEELGQIEYVFSDKTGTLTCNEMEFRECTIAGLAYSSVPGDTSNDDPYSKYLFSLIDEHIKNSANASIINDFLTSLMCCHTVIPEKNEETGEIIYQASSPDEAALVDGASKVFEHTFLARRPQSIECLRKGAREEYEILNVCEFNSTRKRMSIVVRTPEGKIKLYCKGADSVILERLAENNYFVSETLEHLEVSFHFFFL